MVEPEPRGAPLHDPDYPAYSMGAAVDMLNVEPAFLRGLGAHGLIDPQRSSGGHRRYSYNDLRVAARARDVVDEGITLAAACRIVELERALSAARTTINRLRGKLAEAGHPDVEEEQARR
jgi:DNA-binding transcriptional MerR regulator